MLFAKSERGFTLLEALVAVAILSLGILGVGTMLSMALVNDRQTASTRQAENIAQEVVEIMKAEAVRQTETKMKAGQFLRNSSALTPTTECPLLSQICIDKYTGKVDTSCSGSVSEEASDGDRQVYAWRRVCNYKGIPTAWTISNHDFSLLRFDVTVGWGKGCDVYQMKIYLGMYADKSPRDSKCRCTTVTNFVIPSSK